MVSLEKITSNPEFSSQLENKILYSDHDQDIAISYQSTYTLKYVIEGTKYYHFDNQNIKVSENQYLIINHDKTIYTEAQKGTKGLSFFLSPRLINQVYNYHSNNDTSIEFFEVSQRNVNQKIGNWLQKIAFFYQQSPLAFEHQMEELFIAISEIIVEDQIFIDRKFSDLQIIKHQTKQELYKLISLAKDYLNDNLNIPLSLDQISQDIGISKYYLHRLFTEFNNVTPLVYLTAIRIQKAKSLLQDSNDSIFEIAIACGFDNTSYFSKVFKKHTSYSPSQFRKKL